MGKMYHTQANKEPGSIFEEYTCRECNVEWLSNEKITGVCPICRGDIDIYYQPLITCPKCMNTNLILKTTGNRDINYCYYCEDCEDQIGKGAILK